MTVTFEIPEEIEAVLTAQANGLGLTIEAWLQIILMDHAQTVRARSLQRSPEEWVRQFDAWVDGHDRTTPLLSDEDISRESIYPDRI